MPEGARPGGAAPAQSDAARAIAELPAEIAGFRRAGAITDYEQRPGGAGLGAGVSYVQASGQRMLATVYIYDRGQPRRANGGDSPEIAEELRTAAAEINAMVRVGRYRSAVSETAMRIGEAPGSAGMRCANFRVVQQDGAATGDSVCVSVHRGAFVKVRLTAWTPPEPAVAGLFAASFLSAVLDARAGGTGGQPRPRSAARASLQP